MTMRYIPRRVETTHRLRITKGPNAGRIFLLGYERSRIGRPYRYGEDELYLEGVAGAIGRNLYIVHDGTGHRLEVLGYGLRPLLRGVRVDADGAMLFDGDVILLLDVELVYERVPASMSPASVRETDEPAHPRD